VRKFLAQLCSIWVSIKRAKIKSPAKEEVNRKDFTNDFPDDAVVTSGKLPSRDAARYREAGHQEKS